MSHAATQFLFGSVYRSSGLIAYRSDGNDSQIGSVFQFSSFSHLYCLQRAFPVGQHTSSTRITDDKRSHIGKLCRIHQPAQFMFIIRRSNDQIGYRTQISHIKGPMMGRSVFSHQTGTVQAEYHIQFLNSHIMDNIIICPLHERRIYITERQQPFLRHTTRESNGMAFCNTYIKYPVGHFFHHDVHGAP